MRKPKKQYIAHIKIEPNDREELKVLERKYQADSPLLDRHRAVMGTTEPYPARSMNHALIKATVLAKRFGTDLVAGERSVTIAVEAV